MELAVINNFFTIEDLFEESNSGLIDPKLEILINRPEERILKIQASRWSKIALENRLFIKEKEKL